MKISTKSAQRKAPTLNAEFDYDNHLWINGSRGRLDIDTDTLTAQAKAPDRSPAIAQAGATITAGLMTGMS